ncbi:hypothetical protein [Streptomyces sp. NPDC060002]|uniref:hypothetical protein n=1 Tax=Streptomyces sp. NPDC060002 TaxID=3347033 RepID=UPI00368905FF
MDDTVEVTGFRPVLAELTVLAGRQVEGVEGVKGRDAFSAGTGVSEEVLLREGAWLFFQVVNVFLAR